MEMVGRHQRQTKGSSSVKSLDDLPEKTELKKLGSGTPRCPLLGESGHGDTFNAAEATLMRYRISRAWPLDHGRFLAPSGTVIDSNSDDEWSRYARGLTPPWDAQALDDEAYQLMLRSYPDHRHLLG